VRCGILNIWRAKVRRTGHSSAIIFFPPPQQGRGAAMPGMTLGISWSQCPDGSRGFSGTHRQVLVLLQVPAATSDALLATGQYYIRPDVVQPETRREVPAGRVTSSTGHGGWCHRVANPPRHVPSCPLARPSAVAKINTPAWQR